VSGSDISWAICKSAPRSRQIATPAPHHSVFYRPDALPAAEPTASKHWRHFLRPNVYEKKFTGFCQVLKKMHAKENWLLFFCVKSRCRAWLTVYGEFGLSLVPANCVLCPTYVDAVVRCPSTIDLETSIIQDLRPAQGQRGIFFVGADARGRRGGGNMPGHQRPQLSPWPRRLPNRCAHGLCDRIRQVAPPTRVCQDTASDLLDGVLEVVHQNSISDRGSPTCTVQQLNQSINQQIFYSGSSGATTARTTSWMMSGCDCLNKKRSSSRRKVDSDTSRLPLRRQLAVYSRGPIYKISYDNLTIILRQCQSYDRLMTDD